MNENIKVGADIHAGDGGYKLGTEEEYNKFASIRNQSLAKMRLRELIERARKNEPYECHMTKEQWLMTFAELIVKECAVLAARYNESIYPPAPYVDTYILKEFGVEK